MKWQLQHAKARLSEVIRRARTEGPQIITVRGTEEFVLLRKEDLPKSAGPTLYDAFAPIIGLGMDLDALIGPRTVDPPKPPLFADDDPE